MARGTRRTSGRSRQGRAFGSHAPAEPAREVLLQVLVPTHVRRQVELVTVDTGESLRSLVLRALRAIGIKMTDAEMRGRRAKPR